MRIGYLAGLACLFTAASATAQPAAATAPPLGHLPPVHAPDEAAPNIDLGTATSPWAMTGPRFWVNGEYLLWWIRPLKSPDLIQTVPSGPSR